MAVVAVALHVVAAVVVAEEDNKGGIKMEHDPRRKRKQKENFILGGLVVTVVLLLVLGLQMNKVQNKLNTMDSKLGFIEGFFTAVEELQQPSPEEPSLPTIITGDLSDDDAVKGSEDAPVTIVEFSDYECPFCARFATQTLPAIDEQYIKTGKAKLIFRDFPLGFHANAQKAGEAAECAGEQGKYYEMHDKLFAEGVAGGVASFKQYAKELGLDEAKFNECLDSGKMASEVQKDLRDGEAAGVEGTPAFFINGKLVSGAQPFEVFKSIIEEELAK